MSGQAGPGRKRSFEDEQVFQHITQILLESGMSSLSLPVLARRLGVTHQSLGARFVSRSLMLRSYVQWMFDEYEVSFRLATASITSPLELLWNILIFPIDERITGGPPGIPPQWIVLNLELQREEPLREMLEGANRTVLERLKNAICQSIADGLLQNVRADVLAEQLYAATLGGAVYWLFTRDDDDTTRMGRDCSALICPLLVNPEDSQIFSCEIV